MRAGGDWPRAESVEGPRVRLEPLRVEHAAEAARLLDDPALHEYTGGRPETEAQLRARYARQSAGRSPDGREGWLNWMVRSRETGVLVGTVQATVREDGGRACAQIAWVIGSEHQGQGLATQAAGAMVAWLRDRGVQDFAANIHPDHAASMGVARRLGLQATGEMAAGEGRWVSVEP
jgi:RimJ/RimL family protein N-acetyltransferase